MEYVNAIAQLGKQQLNTAPAPQASKERLKSIINQSLGATQRKLKSLQSYRGNSVASTKSVASLPESNETPAEQLVKIGRTLLARKEHFTKEEAALFIRGDAELGRMGVVQLCGVEDRALSTAALVLLDELLLNDEIDHPSRDDFAEAFVGVGFEGLARELCLDRHIMNEDTKHAAFRIALTVGPGHDGSLPLLFRNQRAALDLYLRWSKDLNEPETEEDEEEESIQTGSAFDAEDDRHSTLRSQSSFAKEADLGPKVWDDIAQSVEEDDDIFDFDDGQGLRMRGLMQFSDTASNASDDTQLGSAWNRSTANLTTQRMEDSDPLKVRQTATSSFSQRLFPNQALIDPEGLLERLYSQATRAELARGAAFLNRDLSTRNTVQQKLVHDRLVELVRVRHTVDSLGVSTRKGTELCGKASSTLRSAKTVSDMSLASLLTRESKITQTKRALEVVTERPTNRIILEFASSLSELVREDRWEEAVRLVQRYLDEGGENEDGSFELPTLFVRARNVNATAIQHFVRTIESRLEASPSRECIRAFIDMHGLLPQAFTLVSSPRPRQASMAAAQPNEQANVQDDFVRDTDLLLMTIATTKSERACSALNARFELSALDLADKASRAKAAVVDLLQGLRPDLEPDNVPPNAQGRAKAARASIDRYALSALVVARDLITKTEEYMKWSEPFDMFGIDLERARGALVDRCVELLQAVIFEVAPHGIPGDTTVLLNVNLIGEGLWTSGASATLNLSGLNERSNRTNSESSSQSGSQVHSQYRSFVQQSNQGFISASCPGALELYSQLNELATSTHAGFASLARKCTETLLDFALDGLLAELDLLSRSVPQIAVDRLITNPDVVHGDIDQSDEGKEFCVGLIKDSWTSLEAQMEKVIKPLLTSCSSRAQSIETALQVNERLTKAARFLGTLLGRCAEQYRQRGGDPTGKGFLLLARDCQILRHRILKTLVQSDTADIQAQFDRLEPALATQYLRASSQHLTEIVMDALSGPKDPVSGIRLTDESTLNPASEEPSIISIDERWIMLLHGLAQSVGECETFLGPRYAAKLKSSLAKQLGGKVLAFAEAEAETLGQAKLVRLWASLTFVEKVLKCSDEDIGFSKANRILRAQAMGSETEAMATVQRASVQYSWLIECFTRL